MGCMNGRISASLRFLTLCLLVEYVCSGVLVFLCFNSFGLHLWLIKAYLNTKHSFTHNNINMKTELACQLWPSNFTLSLFNTPPDTGSAGSFWNSLYQINSYFPNFSSLPCNEGGCSEEAGMGRLYKGRSSPTKQNLFVKNCVFILTCLNYSHIQSTLHLMLYTYQDVFSTTQNSVWTRFWCLFVLLPFFVLPLPHWQNISLLRTFFIQGNKNKSLRAR